MTARQLPLDLGHRPAHSRDDLIVSPSNAAAVALVDSWPRWRSPVVVLAGPVGSGKTHIASVWCGQAGALQLPRRKVRDAHGTEGRPVLVEDVDRAGLDETGLFHVLNEVRAAGATALLTARTFPVTWPIGLADLVSRLNAATVVEIGEPDDALLSAILAKLFADRQVEVEPAVVSYVVKRMERSAAAAAHIVDLMDRIALERQSRVTRAVAAEALRQLEAS